MSSESQEVISSENCPSQKNTNPFIVVVYPSCIMKYALASFANLLTLAIGITIGLMLAPHVEKPVRAFSVDPQASSSIPAQVPVQTPTSTPSNIEQIQPTMTAGSVGAYLVLAHHVQTDELVVNGLDTLKLHQGELNLLSRIPGVYPWEIQNIVNDARNTHLYQVAPPKQPQPASEPKK